MCFKYTINPPLGFEGVQYVSTISELRSQSDWAIFTGMGRGLVEKRGRGRKFFMHKSLNGGYLI